MSQSVRHYSDVNVNLRYWFDRLFDMLPNACFYDLGANDGVFSLSYAPRARAVYAFEPAADAHRRLEAQITESDAKNITAFRIALSDHTGTMRLHRYSDDTFNSLFDRTDFELSHYRLESRDYEDVELARLDEVVEARSLPDPQVMKIDIEGAELFALQGGERTIRRARPGIIVEYSVDNTKNAGYDRREIADLLSNWGYGIYGLYRNTDTRLHRGEELEDRGIWNLVCLPPDLERSLAEHDRLDRA